MTPATGGLATGALLALTLASLAATRTATASARARTRVTVPAPAGRAPAVAVPARLRPLLVDAALPVSPTAAWSLWLGGAAAVTAVAGLTGGWGPLVVAAAAATAAPAVGLMLRRGAAGRAVERALPQALEAIAGSLRSGAGIGQALRDVAARTEGPLGDELRRTCDDLDVGVGLGPALAALERRRPTSGVRLSVAALVLGAEAGGAHARALDAVAEGVRARLAVGAEVAALASQARLSALVIAVAPIAFGALAAGADGATATFLLRTPIGLACLVAGLALDGLGALWMHRISQVDA